MSDSEEDFFMATQLPSCFDRKSSEVSDRKVSVVEYFFLVTFNWDLMVGSPFEMNVYEGIKDFPEHWIKGPLSASNRQVKFPVLALGGGVFSLFCKVQKGINYLI